MRIVTFGELLLRLAAPGYTRLFQKDSFETSFCGAEANVAVSLSVFGVDTSFVTRLPENDVGHAAAHALDYFRVDTSEIVYGNGRMGLYYLEKGASQRPSKIIYDRENSAIALAKKNEFDWDRIFAGANWFHWTGITPALSDELAVICKEACRVAKEKKITISCDLNYRSRLWSSEKAQTVIKPLMEYVDVCIGNEEDAEKVLGIKNSTSAETTEINRASYKHISEIICSNYGCRYIATSLRKSFSASRNGWSAVLYDAKELRMYSSTEYDIQIVDRVGGGDSFSAGVIYSLATGMSSQECIDFATAASCLKQTIEGDFNRCTVSDIQTLLKSGGNGRVIR